MRAIILTDKNYKFNSDSLTISMSEKDVPFDTSYELRNPKTGTKLKFDFSHSTGPEFDPETKWIYRADRGSIFRNLKLEVCNDEYITAMNAANYLNAKLRK